MDAEPLTPEQEIERAQSHIVNWGKQTIIFAMNTRANDLRKSTDDPEHIRFVEREAHRLVERFWTESYNEAPKPARIHEVSMPFLKRTFDWVTGHLAGYQLSGG